LKTKGEIENELREIGFKRLSIFRPGNLRTREERDQGRRIGEEIVLKFISVVEIVFPKKMSVYVDNVGRGNREIFKRFLFDFFLIRHLNL